MITSSQEKRKSRGGLGEGDRERRGESGGSKVVAWGGFGGRLKQKRGSKGMGGWVKGGKGKAEDGGRVLWQQSCVLCALDATNAKVSPFVVWLKCTVSHLVSLSHDEINFFTGMCK